MPSMRIVSNDGRIYDFSILKNKVTIGRAKDSDIVLNDNTVSRNHSHLQKTETGYLLTDLGSFNSTKVNGKPIQSTLLNHDDKIEIGLTKLIFLGKEPAEPSPSESLIIAPENGVEKQQQHVVGKSPLVEHPDSQELLISVDAQKSHKEVNTSIPSEAALQEPSIESNLSSLERSNKVLFVLYEISRELNSFQDFNELLKKIMDLIFMVIDADYGFLILTGEKGEDELIPVVIKYRDDQVKAKGPVKASKTIIKKVIHDKVALLTSDAMDDSRLDYAKSVFIQQIRSAMCVPLWKKDKIIGVIQLDSIRVSSQFTQDDLELLKAIGSQMAMIIEQASLNEQIREEERLRNRLERFHSPQVIEMIIKGGQETKDNIMEPKDQTATILFTDIIGFTRLSEQMPAREITLKLNEFFAKMTDVIFKYDGTLDKYIGDALMAVFGAPMVKDDDAYRSILAAQEMRQELTALMENVPDEKKFNIRIGINTGRVVAGNIGSPKRMDYTVVGDPVNIASRLESIAQQNQILIGEETYLLVKDKFNIKKIGSRKVKGKSLEIMAYEVL